MKRFFDSAYNFMFDLDDDGAAPFLVGGFIFMAFIIATLVICAVRGEWI